MRNTMTRWNRLAALIACYLVAATASAQTLSDTRRAFIDLHLGPNSDDTRSDETSLPGVTWGSGGAIGADLPKWGLEFDVGVPQWHVQHRTHRYQFVGASHDYEQQFQFYEDASTERHRSIELMVLRRKNVPLNRWATFTWLFGGGYALRPNEVTTVTREVLPDGRLQEVNATTTTDSHNYLAATAGFDVELRIAARLSVLPRLRVTVFPSLIDDSGSAPKMVVMHPEIGVRWRF
jgi:hypothetical protein